MNKIEKQKVALIIFGFICLVLGICSIVGAVALFTSARWYTIILGILLVILFILLILLSVYFLWVGFAQVATKGNLMQGNITKNGTVNAKLCSKCGNVLPEGAVCCPKCGQTASSCKVCSCGAENNIENKKCTSCGKDLD